MRNWIMLLLTLALAVVGGLLLFSYSQKSQNQTPKENQTSQDTIELAKQKAQELYSQKKKEGTNFSQGPCLGTIMDDWVADIAHSSRQTVDDQPENQCLDFAEGRASHFVELDPEGNFIRAQ